VAPKLLTDRIDPATESVIARVSPTHLTDVGVPPGFRAGEPGPVGEENP